MISFTPTATTSLLPKLLDDNETVVETNPETNALSPRNKQEESARINVITIAILALVNVFVVLVVVVQKRIKNMEYTAKKAPSDLKEEEYPRKSGVQKSDNTVL